MVHIMGIMTDLYSDQQLAVIREYSTNALDAHVEAGVVDPIEVTLPTPLSPFIKIRDYGFGLDRDDIAEIYSKYGASTKRESNDVVGMLGLGCKSALTYTDQFTVSSIKNGVKTEVAVSRDADGAGSMTVIDQYPTDERQGTEIIVPAKRDNNFAYKADEFFKYWKKGTVLIDGEQPKFVDERDDVRSFWIADDLLITDERNEDVVVMGNVAYPFPSDHYTYKRYSVTAFVPIGTVNFTPSREALMTNTKTNETIEAIRERVEKEAPASVSKALNEAEDLRAALKLYHETTEIFDFKVEAQYKGKVIPMASDAPRIGGTKDKPLVQEFVVVKPTPRKGYRDKGWTRMRQYPSSLWPRTIWIRGYNGTDFSPYKRKKLDQWLVEKGLDQPENFVFTAKVPNHHWIDKDTIHNWSEIEAQKIVVERTMNQNGRVAGSYEGYVDGNLKYEIKASEIDTTKPILYINKTYYTWNSEAFHMANKENPKGWTLVELPNNRLAKFLRDFPMAQSMTDYIKGLAQKWADNLTDDDKLYLVIKNTAGYELESLLKGLDMSEIEDPDLVSTHDILKQRDNKLLTMYKTFSGYVNGSVTKDVEWEDPTTKYPLLQSLRLYGTMGSTMKREVTIYLNAAYAAGQEEA
jgi:hypothetical protein